jgi:hypothetical protein
VCPANAQGQDIESGRETAGRHLHLDELPRLKALVSGPEGEEILAELHKLLQREPPRARRFQRDLFARVRADPEQPAELAIVRDLSASGVRLQLAASAQLDVIKAHDVSIEMRLPGSPFVNCEAMLVRVVERNKNGVVLAFSFVEAVRRDPAFVALLEQLAKVTPGDGR